MIEHWSYPVAIGRETLLHFLLPEQGFFMIWASEATLANGPIGGLFKEPEESDGWHDLENGVVSLAAR
jgi:hypothetical protein